MMELARNKISLLLLKLRLELRSTVCLMMINYDDTGDYMDYKSMWRPLLCTLDWGSLGLLAPNEGDLNAFI